MPGTLLAPIDIAAIAIGEFLVELRRLFVDRISEGIAIDAHEDLSDNIVVPRGERRGARVRIALKEIIDKRRDMAVYEALGAIVRDETASVEFIEEGVDESFIARLTDADPRVIHDDELSVGVGIADDKRRHDRAVAAGRAAREDDPLGIGEARLRHDEACA